MSGRGLLHLGILLENMRREGYELQVSKPEMITKKVDDVLMEPVEIAMVDVPNEYSGRVIEIFGSRKGFVEKMDQRQDRTASMAACCNRGGPLMTLRFWIEPLLDIVACKTTVP